MCIINHKIGTKIEDIKKIILFVTKDNFSPVLFFFFFINAITLVYIMLNNIVINDI